LWNPRLREAATTLGASFDDSNSEVRINTFFFKKMYLYIKKLYLCKYLRIEDKWNAEMPEKK